MAIKNFFNNIASIFDGNPETMPTNTIGQGLVKFGQKAKNAAISFGDNIKAAFDGNPETKIEGKTMYKETIGKTPIFDGNPETTPNSIIGQGIATAIDGTRKEYQNIVKDLSPSHSTTIGEKENTQNEEPEPNGNSAPNEELTPNEQANLDLEKIWAREDEIRKETQAREDSAYQRAIADMRKAGINPELLGVNPANSGGGITQASKKENVLSSQISALTQQMTNALSNEIKQEEGAKDRTQDIISTILMAWLLKKK